MKAASRIRQAGKPKNVGVRYIR